MAHECLVMSNRPGPYLVESGAAVWSSVWADWDVRLPAGSIHVGMALRFRASGVMGIGAAGMSLRPVPAFSATAGVYTNQGKTLLFGNPVVTTALGSPFSWMWDFTMVCRTVPVAGATFFPGAFFASVGVVGSTAGVKDSLVPSIVSPPVVSTGAAVPTTDLFIGLSISSSAAASYEIQVQNYRVDKIA